MTRSDPVGRKPVSKVERAQMNVEDGAFTFEKTDGQVRADFERLRRLSPGDTIDKDVEWEVRTGCPTPNRLHLFRSVRAGQLLGERMHWPHRVKTSTVWCKSGQEVLDRWNRDPEFLRRASERIERVTQNRKFTRSGLVYDTIRSNSALLTVTHFRATVSKYLCDVTRAETVLDFSAGWGDRLTGFLASDTVERIHLVDPRPGSMEACRSQYEFVGSTKGLTLHRGPAEDILPTLPTETFDLIVSSPPYFNVENYGETHSESEGQIRMKVDTVEEYVAVFLRPVITNCARLLKPGGTLAINLDDNLRLKILVCQTALDIASTIPTLTFVGTAGLRKGTGFGQGSKSCTKSKAEPIYMWRRA